MLLQHNKSEALLEDAVDMHKLSRQCAAKLQYDFPLPIDQKKTYTCVPICVTALVDWHLQKTCKSTKWRTCAQMLYEMRQDIEQHGMSCQDALDKLQRLGCWSARDYDAFRKENMGKSKNLHPRQQSVREHKRREPFPNSLLPTSSGSIETSRRHTAYKSETNKKWQNALLASLAKPSTSLSLTRRVQIHSFWRISTLDGAKVALAHYGPCLLVTPFYNTSGEFWKPTTRNYLRHFRRLDETAKASPPSSSTQKANNELPVRFQERVKECEQHIDLVPKPTRFHCTIIIGYNSTGLIGRNSWGTHWSNSHGDFLFPYKDVDKYATELWCIRGVAPPRDPRASV